MLLHSIEYVRLKEYHVEIYWRRKKEIMRNGLEITLYTKGSMQQHPELPL